jgi:hypothetical protein
LWGIQSGVTARLLCVQGSMACGRCLLLAWLLHCHVWRCAVGAGLLGVLELLNCIQGRHELLLGTLQLRLQGMHLQATCKAVHLTQRSRSRGKLQHFQEITWL